MLMIDLQKLRDDPQAYFAALERKGAKIDVDEILELDDERRDLLQKVEALRRTQNEANQKIARAEAQEKSKLIAEMKQVSDDLKLLENKLEKAQIALEKLLIEVPNPPHESVPDGGEEDASELKKVGAVREFDFPIKNHAELGELCDLIDTKRGAKVSGSRFYYLKNDAVNLEFALAQFALEILQQKGFTPMITPTLVREKAMIGTGFFPADRFEIYEVNPSSEANPEGDDLFLVGTSEVPLTMFHCDEILDPDLPKRYVGWSTCYRREAGAYGKDTKGIFRVHQFDKLEMFSFCDPKKSWEEHDFLVSVQEEILQSLKLPYRAVNIAAGDLGAPAAKKIDLEVWIPSEKRYRELTSCSNCTDFQAHRANVRFRGEGGSEYVHTLNGTAIAMTRMLIAIFENYQLENGAIEIPEVLRKWTGKNVITPKD
ncbi:MAG: serine--tRNA ligase [Candidatus Peribacteraceae bacterium]|nr:serine--tRNA ligase [Candidatus Peribacteraceae bacterium]